MLTTGRRRALTVLAVMWIAALVLGFVVQTTEVSGILGWALIGFGSIGFVAIGAIGIWLLVDWLGREQSRQGRDHG